MSKVALSGNASGTGTFTIASPNSNTDRVLTLPDNTGTILTTATAGVPVNGPAFSAYKSGSDQNISANTVTKITFETEEFDTNSNFASSRFTPTVAGYYIITGGVRIESNGTGEYLVAIWKNGASYKRGNNTAFTPNGGWYQGNVAAVVYLNGSTDYVEIYAAAAGSGSLSIYKEADLVFFTGAMVRSAT
jgi:hypothetical protein